MPLFGQTCMQSSVTLRGSVPWLRVAIVRETVPHIRSADAAQKRLATERSYIEPALCLRVRRTDTVNGQAGRAWEGRDGCNRAERL